jgi:hypothetical protein
MNEVYNSPVHRELHAAKGNKTEVRIRFSPAPRLRLGAGFNPAADR